MLVAYSHFKTSLTYPVFVRFVGCVGKYIYPLGKFKFIFNISNLSAYT